MTDGVLGGAGGRGVRRGVPSQEVGVGEDVEVSFGLAARGKGVPCALGPVGQSLGERFDLTPNPLAQGSERL